MLWHRQAIFESKGDKLSSPAECRIWTQRVSETQSSADWMPADKPTELSRIKLKTWTRQPVPMISKHSAHLTLLQFCIRTWLWRYNYLLLLISMLWQRQAIFESKGDKLSFSAECRIRTQRVSETQSSADWMLDDKPTELSRIKLKTWTRQPVPMISKNSAHLTYIHPSIHTYIHVVNFDALAEASDFRFERRQVAFLCWMQDSNPERLWNRIFSRLNARWQTDWSIEDQVKNLSSTARPYDQRASSLLDPIAVWHSYLAVAIYVFVDVNFETLAQASDCRIERRQVVFLWWVPLQGSNPDGLWNRIPSRLNARWQTEESRIKLKTWTRQPVLMISEHSAHSTPLPFGICTWRWR